jgi:SAM-dependent methyltransferase
MKYNPLMLSTTVVLVSLGAVMARAGERADDILKATGIQGGLVVHIGCGDGALTAELQAHKSLVVHGLDTDATNIQKARKQIAAKGQYGAVSVATWDGERLPYTDNLVNVIVCSDPNVQCSAEEIARVLAPRGVACLQKGFTFDVSGFKPQLSGDWVLYRKPVPPEIDEWSHHCHGPDGNPVAQDDVVGPPKGFQWIQEPRWMRSHDSDSSISCMVTANGRIIYMEDWAPISLPGDNNLPDNWHLTARDAFNGILLWKIPVKSWGWREWKDTWHAGRGENTPVNIHRRVVAAGDKIYATLGFNASVSELDAATGKVLKTYKGTEGTREVIFHNGQLVLTVPEQKHLKVMVLDSATEKIVWQTNAIYGGTDRESSRLPLSLQPVLNAAVDNDAVCFVNGSEIVCLDRKTGETGWTRKVLQAEDQSAGKKKTKAEPSNTLWAGTLIVSDGVVIYSQPGKVSAFSIPDGR